MRRAGRFTFGILCLLTAQMPAAAVEPDDTPWDLRGTDAAGKPKTIDDLLARDQLTIIEDTDIPPPPGQDQRDLLDNQSGERFEEDRLTPKLPAEIHPAPSRAPDTALFPVDSAPVAPSVAIKRVDPAPPAEPPVTKTLEPASQDDLSARNGHLSPEAVAPIAAPRRAVTPVGPAAPAASTAAAPESPSAAPPAAQAEQTRTQPAPAQPPATGVRPSATGPAQAANAPSPVAAPAAATQAAQSPGQTGPGKFLPTQAAPSPTTPAPKPSEAAPGVTLPPSPAVAVQSPAPAALPTAPPPHAAVAHDGYDPGAPPPLAVPSEQVSQPSVAVNGKLYLPLRRYFETKAAVTLSGYDMEDRAALSAYYDKTVGEAMWVSRSGFNSAAETLIEEIKKADEWGLASADYKLPGLVKVGAGDFNYEDLADAEIKLSLAAMEYARHARGDRINNPAEQLSSYLDRKPQIIERPKLLDELAAAPDKAAFLRGLHPKHPQFAKLRELLLKTRAAQIAGKELEPIPDGPKITPGKTHWQVALLRQRLNVTSPPQKPDGSPADAEYYDEALARAVIDYKEKNEISPASATVTNDLRRALNKSQIVSEDAILANMEEWRWMPDDLGATHVFVNVPEFLVRVKKNDQIIHEERIVTGRIETQTPIFSNRMKTIVFQPSWNVPESIKVNELLPKLRAGDNPIASQGLRLERNGRDIDVWDVDWNTQDIRNYHIFQPPGDANVLGIVKFLFPNKHSVYLHDTPTKRLFSEKVRTFSHGCMRVRNPVQLAEVIMAEDKGWDKEQVNELITTGPEDNDITLDKPLPVHVTYFTLWVADNGEVKSFADVYGHEKRIILGLHGRWEEIEKAPDHLAPADPNLAASTREDWGDEDGEPAQRRRAKAARYSEDQPTRQVYRAPPLPPPGYKQVSPKKNGSVITDLFNNIFGN